MNKTAFHWDDPLPLGQQLTDNERLAQDIHALILGRTQTGISTFLGA